MGGKRGCHALSAPKNKENSFLNAQKVQRFSQQGSELK